MLTWLAYLAADLIVRMLPARAADGLGVGIARLAFALRVPARARLAENHARLREREPGPPRARPSTISRGASSTSCDSVTLRPTSCWERSKCTAPNTSRPRAPPGVA
jgi:hypothetical protein